MNDKEFEEKYKLYSKLLYSIIYGYVLNKDDSDDILQDVFIKYINLKKKFKDLDSEKYYLVRMTINLCKDYYIKNVKLIHIENDIVDENNNMYVLRKIITTLPPKYKEIIILHYYNSFDIKTISNILHISNEAVRKRLERAKDKIKEGLGDDYEIR